MSVLDDLIQALRDYPDKYVKLSVVDFEEPGTVINAGEICTFRIRVANNGYLDMNNVYLHLNSASGITQLSQTDIFGTPVNFMNHLQTAHMNLPSRTAATTRTLYMKALKATTKKQLFEAHLGEWDAGLGSLLRVYAGHDWGASIKFSEEILAA